MPTMLPFPESIPVAPIFEEALLPILFLFLSSDNRCAGSCHPTINNINNQTFPESGKRTRETLTTIGNLRTASTEPPFVPTSGLASMQSTCCPTCKYLITYLEIRAVANELDVPSTTEHTEMNNSSIPMTGFLPVKSEARPQP